MDDICEPLARGPPGLRSCIAKAMMGRVSAEIRHREPGQLETGTEGRADSLPPQADSRDRERTAHSARANTFFFISISPFRLMDDICEPLARDPGQLETGTEGRAEHGPGAARLRDAGFLGRDGCARHVGEAPTLMVADSLPPQADSRDRERTAHSARANTKPPFKKLNTSAIGTASKSRWTPRKRFTYFSASKQICQCGILHRRGRDKARCFVPSHKISGFTRPQGESPSPARPVF